MAQEVACLPLRGSRSVCTCQHPAPWEIVIHGTRCRLQQAPTLLFYILQKPILVSRMVTRALKDPCNKMADLKIDEDFESFMEVDDDKITDTEVSHSTTERNQVFLEMTIL